MRIHFLTALTVFAFAGWIGVEARDFAVLVLVVMAVIIAEMFNTALENVVDIVSPDYHPLAKVAKDVAAGAVLISAIGAVVVGLCILVVGKF